eukprot:scaffold179_cov368-Prasinococcus_capsulatus_cf.AAC.32
MTEPVVDSALFVPRCEALFTSLLERNEAQWAEAEVLYVPHGTPYEELVYLKSISLQTWLFGYELSDTLLLFSKKDKTLHAVASKKKTALVQTQAEKAKEAGITIKTYTKGKGEDGEAQLKEAFESAGLGAGTVVGKVLKESPEGAFCGLCARLLDESKATVVDVARSFAELLATKDKTEILNVKKAAYMSASVMKGFVNPKIESIIEEEKTVSHAQLSQDTEDVISDPKRVSVKLRPENLEACYPPIFQSGSKFDLKPSAVSDEANLHQGIIICSLGARYSFYCSNIARTFIIDPTDAQQKEYKALLKAQAAAIGQLKDGNTLSSVYRAAAESLAQSGLSGNLTKNVGFGMGLEFRDSTYLLNAKNERVVQAGMIFNLALGLENLKTTASGDDKTYALMIADTVIVQEAGKDAEVATSAAAKEWKDIGYYLQGLDEDAEEQEPDEPKEVKRRGSGRGTVVLDGTLRSDANEEAKEARRKQVQDELIDKKNQETVQRLKMASQEKPTKAALGGNADVVTYTHVDNVPSQSQLMIQVDERAEALLLPIRGLLVPFHVSTVKGVTSRQEGSATYVHISFNVPGSAFGATYAPAVKFPNSIFIREASFRSLDARHCNQVVTQLKTMRRHVVSRENERRERASLVVQESLRLASGRPLRLNDLMVRPGLGGRGKKLPGWLEAHANGFRYSTRDQHVDILYANIKHAFFQPAESEMITLLHFHLVNPIIINKKKTVDVQFYTEVMEAVQTLDGSRRNARDPDEIEEEQRERERRNRINSNFQNYVRHVQDVWSRDHKDLLLEFDIPFRELGFQGVPHKTSSFVIPTVNCLVDLIEMPFFVVSISEIEIINLERVGFGLKNFDMAIVFKDFTKDVVRVDAIPIQSIDTVKEWLSSMKIKYYESRMNIAWKPVLKKIIDDPDEFLEEGGWEFLNLERNSDESDDDEEEEESDFQPDSDGSEEEEEESSEDYSDEDEDEDEADDDESEGMDWSDLEEEARQADKEKDPDDSDDEKRKRAKSNGSKHPHKRPHSKVCAEHGT